MTLVKAHTEKLKGKGIWAMVILTFCFFNLHGQEQNLKETILEKDSIFWKAYNECDIPTMSQFLAEDIEFYHDKGGIDLGSEQLNEVMKNGLCKTGTNHVRREAISESIEVFPMQDNGTIYGAILRGEHLFYIQEDKTERLDGQAKFNHLWLIIDGDWKMHRVLSYDHRPPEYKNRQQN